MTVIHQVTDTHVPADSTRRAHQNFVRQMSFVRQNRPDLLVISGDLPEEDGSREIYRLMESLLPPDLEIVIIPGNHDERQALIDVFGNARCRSRDFWHTIALDEIDLVFADSSSGTVPDEHLENLRSPSIRPGSVLFIHHPTQKLSDGFMDRNYPLVNLDDTDTAIRQSNIDHVFCGHFHCEHVREDGYRLHVTPSAAFTIDLHSEEPVITFDRVPVRTIRVDGRQCHTEIIDLA